MTLSTGFAAEGILSAVAAAVAARKCSPPDWVFMTDSSGGVAAGWPASSHLGGGGNTGLEAAGSDPEMAVIL